VQPDSLEYEAYPGDWLPLIILRLSAVLKEVVRAVRKFEAALEERERAKGIKTDRGKPLVHRLAAIGVPKAAIEETMKLFGAFELEMARLASKAKSVRFSA
jgi:hypothetical protein